MFQPGSGHPHQRVCMRSPLVMGLSTSILQSRCWELNLIFLFDGALIQTVHVQTAPVHVQNRTKVQYSTSQSHETAFLSLYVYFNI
jgi:hypothetical protein